MVAATSRRKSHCMLRRETAGYVILKYGRNGGRLRPPDRDDTDRITIHRAIRQLGGANVWLSVSSNRSAAVLQSIEQAARIGVEFG